MKRLRKTLEHNEHILSSHATITRDSSLDVIFPLAEFDLNDLLFGTPKCKDYTNLNPKLNPNEATATHLLNEMAGIADALGYLHERLYLEDGKKIICVHMDMKPDNILVFVHPSTPCGRWKISDFGLSRIKGSARGKTNTSSGAREASYRFSNTLARRYAGSFQPPEVGISKELNARIIGPECDLWGFGCALSLVVAYVFGKEDLVKDFQCQRSREKSGGKSKSHEHDFFYRDGGRKVNPEVMSWLQDHHRKEGQNEPWVGNCIQLIKDILQIEPSLRPVASVIRKRLLDEVVGRIRHTRRGSENSIPSTSSLADSRVSIHANTITENTRPSLPSSAPYPLEYIRCLKSTFAKIELPSERPIQTAISSYNGFLVFLFEKSFFIASVAQLAESWNTTQSHLRAKTVDHYYHLEPALEQRKWRSMVLSGSFLMLLSGWDPSTKERVVRITVVQSAIFQ